MYNLKYFILTGEPTELNPPDSHLILNALGEEDREKGTFILPDRVPDNVENREVEKKALFDILPEIRANFSDNQPRNQLALNLRNRTLISTASYLKDKYNGYCDRLDKLQSKQREGLFALKKYLNSKISTQSESLKIHEEELKKIKEELKSFPSKDIKETLSIVRKDSIGSLSNYSKFIDSSEIDNAVNFIHFYLDPETTQNSEIDKAVEILRNKLHILRANIIKLEGGKEFNNITNSGNQFSYETEKSKIKENLNKINQIANEYSDHVLELEKSEDIHNSDIWNRNYISEISKCYDEIVNTVNICNEKKFNFDSNIKYCVRILLNEKFQVSNTSNETEISNRFNQAQDALRKVKFANNIHNVYLNCLKEIKRRKDIFEEDYKRYINEYNEGIEKKVKLENRLRRDFLNEQKKLLGDFDVPPSLVHGINEFVEIPFVEIDSDSSDNEIESDDYENPLKFSILYPNNEKQRFHTNQKANDIATKFTIQLREKDEKITELELMLKKDHDLIERLKKELENNRSNFKTLNQKFTEVSLKESELKRAMDSLTNENTLLANQKKNLLSNLEQCKNDLDDLKNENQILKANQIYQTEQEIGIQNLQNELKNMQTVISNLKNDSKSKLLEIEEYRKTITNYQTEIEKIASISNTNLEALKNAEETIKQKEIENNIASQKLTEDYRLLFEKEQKTREEHYQLNIKYNEAIEKVQRIVKIMLETKEENEKLKQDIITLESKQKNMDLEFQERISTNTAIEESTKLHIQKLENDLQFKKEQLELNVNRLHQQSSEIAHLQQQIENNSKQIVSNFIEEFNTSIRHPIEKAWKISSNSLKNIDILSQKKASNANESLLNIKAQLKEVELSLEQINIVIDNTSNTFPITQQLSIITNDLYSVLHNIIESITKISENFNSQKQDKNDNEYINVSESNNSDPKPHSIIYFKKMGNYFTIDSKDEETYYLDPESSRVFLEQNPSCNFIIGEVIQVIQRNKMDDPLHLGKNYKTILVGMINE